MSSTQIRTRRTSVFQEVTIRLFDIPVWKQNLVPVTDYGLTLQTKDNRKEKLLLLIFYHEYRVEPRIGTSTEDVQDYKFQVTLVEVTKQYDF